MDSFEYFEPNTIEDAVELLLRHGPRAKPLAGGTDVMVDLLHGAEPPGCLVSLINIETLPNINDGDGQLRIGAGTTLRDIGLSEAVHKSYPMLSEGVAVIGSQQIRNIATIGGNICNAVPSADAAPPLLAADATVEVYGPEGERQIVIQDFFKGPRQTDLAHAELAIAFVLPEVGLRTGSIYRRFTPRGAMDLAMVGVAVCITLEHGSDIIQEAKIALGAVAPVPLRADAAEAVLIGNTLSNELIEEAAELVVGCSKPINDVRGSADYRRHITRYLARECLLEASERAKNASGGASGS